ncbi:DUF6576 domain-containing protein [Alienimonas californiensis]|uniref:DUF6576 domain-containing protein n=1 Tax=Alienimonas californiensis TaxID=2527989 RepID=UPI0011A70B37|nr:DUF6576 domain-containing protein [Alienimonas californiensis]
MGIAAAARTGDLALGAWALTGLVLAAAVTEVVRCAVAARLGAPVTDLLLWPLGGLEGEDDVPPRPPWVHLLVPATGTALCATIWGAAQAAGATIVLSPIPSQAGALLIAAAAVAGANLLPAWPLAAGRAVRDMWALRSGPYAAGVAAAGLTHLIGALWLFLALAIGSAWVAVAAAAVMLAARERRPRPRPAPRPQSDETFLGYDFSAGYTSLERAGGNGDEPAAATDVDEDDRAAGVPPSGTLARWRRQREAARRAREREERAREELEVDRLLRKISAQGERALTAAERRTLTRAAARLRQGPTEG